MKLDIASSPFRNGPAWWSTGLLGLLILAGAPLDLRAQRDFSIKLAPTNQTAIRITWKAQSVVPLPGQIMVPQFQVERSFDLTNWAPVSSLFSPNLGQTLDWGEPRGSIGFYRVASIIRKQYAQLSNARLAGGELSGADFFGANLFGASLNGSNLAGATLAGADVRTANLKQADLRGADLFGIQALFTTFDSATLAGADARFGDFEAGSFFNADLTGADFRFAILSRADFDFAVLNQVKLDDNTLIDPKPKLIWQIVNEGRPGGVLTNQDLSFASLIGANLNGAKLNGSDLSATDLRDADVRGANFTLANLRFVDFRGTLIDSNTIIEPKQRLVWNLINQGGAGADLHGTNLSSVLLAGVNLSSANLSNTVCTTSIFEQAN
ncbi:MAG TPA: pentapeptide repeat-containing protein, partial [Candidatus Dormibacteraeota bacterium]|nr:pentapeptide repeat-containing protein [Candidatus Dormibacteraeota bacterium]